MNIGDFKFKIKSENNKDIEVLSSATTYLEFNSGMVNIKYQQNKMVVSIENISAKNFELEAMR